MIFTSLDALIPFARQRAMRGILDGTTLTEHLVYSCMHYYRLDLDRVANILFTRDSGHHSSGWWKNPDYERCWHLSLSYSDFRGRGFLPQDKPKSAELARAFFGEDAKLCWIEPPYSDRGKESDTYHYRLFCDAGWQPIKPRGEVYSKDWTPAGWLSFSDLHAEAA